MAIKIIFVVNAKAPMTPSNEKLASSTSKYKNAPRPPRAPKFVALFE